MITLYHGSYIQVGKPLVKLGRKKVDFGQGFYLTKLRQQASSWAKTIAERKGRNALPTLSIYSFDYDAGVIGTGTLIHSFGSMNLSLVIFIPLKQVAMCTCINKNQFQRIIVLAPNQQPIWFKMTFPTARILSRQSMGFVF